MNDDRLFHIALASEWEAARHAGFYNRSTLGATVDDIGFIHCSRGMSQTEATIARFYAQIEEPLTLLHIDEEALAAHGLRVVDEHALAGDEDSESFPHIYGGPLSLETIAEAVVWQR